MTELWTPPLVDFESRADKSQADLKKVGGRRYWEHPSAEVICAVVYVEGEFVEWEPGDPCPFGKTRPDAMAAHNWMTFDRHAYRWLGWPWPRREIDTMQCAARAGYPGSLDKLSTRLLGRRKDVEGSKFTLKFSQPSRAKKTLGQLPPITPADRARIMAYCRRDVEDLRDLWPHFAFGLDLEPDVEAADRTINDRGILFDCDLARRLLAEDARHGAEAVGVDPVVLDGPGLVRRLKELGAKCTNPDTSTMRRLLVRHPDADDPIHKLAQERLFVAGIRHSATFCRWMRESGAEECHSAEADEIEQYEQHESEDVRALVSARQSLASIVRGKLEAGLLRVSPDGRLRDIVKYYGAHTGRWSGVGIQLHNLPRPDEEFEEWTNEDICTLAEYVKRGGPCRPVDMPVLLRACLYAAAGHLLIERDFKGVEARFLAWISGDIGALETFASGRDPYKVAAAAIFGCAYEDVDKSMRQVGKIAELMLGYGAGARKFEENAAKALAKKGLTLEGVGVTGKEVVEKFRELHAPIQAFWKTIERAAMDAINGRSYGFGLREMFRFERDGDDTALILPSGRFIVYPGLRFASKRDAALANEALEKKGLKGDRRSGGLVFNGHRGPDWTYGGKLTENGVQAGCRCLLAGAIVRAESWSLPVVLHVHDSMAVEVPRKLQKEAEAALDSAMCTLPEWAYDFPIGADGFTGKRYQK